MPILPLYKKQKASIAAAIQPCTFESGTLIKTDLQKIQLVSYDHDDGVLPERDGR